MQPSVCIIILNWNGIQVTRDCLNSLSKIDYHNFKIVVVDNGSKDDSVNKLKTEFSDKFIKILALENNYGFTGGNNIGIEYAQVKYSPDYFLLLNNDTTVEKTFLKEMVNAALDNRDCYAIVPKIFYYDHPEVIWYAGGSVNTLTAVVNQYGRNKIDSDKFNVSKRVSFMNGCCALISKEAINELGALDNDFFAYSEDTDYSLRILKSNHSILYIPKAVVYHKVAYSSEANTGKWFAFYLATRNLIVLQKKHLPKHMIPLFILAFGVRWVLYMSVKHTLLNDFKAVKGIWNGIVDGVNSRLRFVQVISGPTKINEIIKDEFSPVCSN